MVVSNYIGRYQENPSMNIFEELPSIPLISVSYNVDSIFDMNTGEYLPGANGEMILCGGLPNVVSFIGPPNCSKSILSQYMNISVLNRIKYYKLSIFDTEGSVKYSRLKVFSKRFPNLKNIDHGSPYLEPDDIKIKVTSEGEIHGDEYFEKIKDICEKKRTNKNDFIDTPFVDSRGVFIKARTPFGVMLDSISQMTFTPVLDKANKLSLGDSGNNMKSARNALIKRDMISQLPYLTNTSGMIFTTVTHQGNDMQAGDKFAPQQHKLTHSNKATVPTGSTKLSQYINGLTVELFNSKDCNNAVYNTGVLYPILDIDREPGCTDLQRVKAVITRNKNGATGRALELLVSQREGFLPHLTMFDFLKGYKSFGMEGNNVTYSLTLLPDVKLTRTTVRGLIEENELLRRALEITYEICMMRILWGGAPGDNVAEDKVWCTPEVLYKDITECGYDWNVLLNTRGWWDFNESKNPINYLSTLDILRMRKKLYKPYWQ